MTYHVLIGIASLVEGEDSLVNHRVDIIPLNGGDHVFHQSLGANIHTTGSADVGQALNDARRGLGATQETNDADNTLELDGCQTLLQGAGTTHLDDVVNTLLVVGETPGRLAPVLVLLVVDNVVCAKLLQDVSLVLRGSGGNDCCSCGFGKLYT